MQEPKITIVVRDYMVEAVYGCGSAAAIPVEVLDMDRPAQVTPDEEAEFDAAQKRIDKIEADPEWVRLY